MTDELKGFEPVGTVDSHYVEYNGDYTYAIWADEDSPPKKGTKLYTADQLAEVVQQRDELQKDAERYRFLKATGSIVVDWMPLLPPEEDSYDAVIDAAIAKVQP